MVIVVERPLFPVQQENFQSSTTNRAALNSKHTRKTVTVPRHPRQCNTIAWNPLETNIIAAGLEKSRSDHSVLVWDIMKCPLTNDLNGSNRLSMNTVAPAVELAKPIAELGVSESTHSLAWFNTNCKLMAVGMNMKNIKLIDVRGGWKRASPWKGEKCGTCCRFDQGGEFDADQGSLWDLHRSARRQASGFVHG